jgi:dTDP-glucose pyrophosphorylase
MKKLRNIDWVICAAGSGSRFKNKGINISKPNIQLHGMSFLERSAMCLDVLPGDQIIFITQKNDHAETNISKVKNIFPWAIIKHIKLKTITKGQLDTFYKSKKYLRKNASVAIWNCDTYFRSNALTINLRETKYDGLVPCGKMPGSHWSFFKTNKQGIVTDAAEKVKISDWASVGFYFFKSSSKLIKMTEKLLNKAPDERLNEYYVSNIYPLYLKKGLKILNCPVDLFMPFGTPEEVSKYWSVGLNKFKKENL